MFSCGGELARLSAEGKSTLVATCFTHLPEDEAKQERLKVFSDYEQRCREDEAALKVVGAGHRWLGFTERVFREPRIRAPRIFRTPRAVSEFVNLPALRDAIRSLLREFPESRFLFPLAVGNHFDHVETFLACFEVALEENRLANAEFYEDAYAIDPGARQDPFRDAKPQPTRSAGRLTPPLALRAMSLAMALFRGGPPIESFLRVKGVQVSWELSPVDIHDFEAQKLDAVFRYESQVGLMGGPDRLGRVFRHQHALWGGAEPRWRAKTDGAKELYGRSGGLVSVAGFC